MVSSQERRWVIRFALVMLVVTGIPYLIGYARQGTDWRFTGFVFGVEDGNSYIAKMLGGEAGAWLFRTPYTAYPQQGLLAFLPYLLLGKLSAPPAQHEQLVVLFHLFRWVSGFLFALASYDFLALFVVDVRLRRLGLALASMGGGLGWLVLLGLKTGGYQGLPLEFYSPESFGFLSVYGLPHLAAGRAFLLWGLRAYLGGGERRTALRAGLWWLLLGLMQPLTVVVAWTLVGAHLGLSGVLMRLGRVVEDWGWFRRQLERALWMGLVSAPLVVYTFVAFRVDPFLSGWEGQNLILSPPPLDYLLAYGIVLPFAVKGALAFWRQSNRPALLLVAWAVLLPVLAYAPYNLQRRLPEGVWVALLALALKGVESGGGTGWQRARWVLYQGFLPALLLLLGGGWAAWQPSVPLFRPADEVAAFQWLAKEAQPGAVTLTAFETGNALPAWAPLRVVVGHGPESVRLAELKPLVQRFYAGMLTAEDERVLLDELQVRYVFSGPEERKLGERPGFAQARLVPVYVRGDYRLWEVVH